MLQWPAHQAKHCWQLHLDHHLVVAHFDPAFVGATGTRESIDALAASLGVAVIVGPPAPDGSYAVDHSAAIFLVDPEARIAALFGAPHDAATIARDYRRIVAAR